MIRLCRFIFAFILIQELLFLDIEANDDYCCKTENQINPIMKKYYDLYSECAKNEGII